ncbi:27-O-demethylrifamycin SV methyltransferase [Frankliniella fusca]|uniref:27-O-demethylrifamycin SV methyltransferase n=1 Tax=Frankliniella fusca TaxID=407009 RepID=A0AAE1HEC8_9NEOP|nr:27-O-demethylrifamycin SV methyltransferase [Frankliniella fusca]
MPKLIPIEIPEEEQETSEEEENLSEFVLDLPDHYFDLRASTIGQHQRDARQGLLRQATRMTRNTERNFPGPSIGDTVAVPTADPDRARGDSRNVMAVVTEVLDNGLYRVGNEHGVLGRALSRNQFTVSKHRFLDVKNVQRDKELTTRSIATTSSITGGKKMFGTSNALIRVVNISLSDILAIFSASGRQKFLACVSRGTKLEPDYCLVMQPTPGDEGLVLESDPSCLLNPYPSPNPWTAKEKRDGALQQARHLCH